MANISMELLADWTRPGQRRSLTVAEATDCVVENYCKRLTFQGLCPVENGGHCTACKDRIGKMFHLERARNPAAYLNIMAREQAALAADSFKTSKPAPKITQPIPASEHGRTPYPFEELLKSL